MKNTTIQHEMQHELNVTSFFSVLHTMAVTHIKI